MTADNLFVAGNVDPFKHLYSRDFVGHKKKVHSVAWNCEGKKLASGSVDQTVRIWPVESTVNKMREVELRGHTGGVDNVAWDPLHPEILTSVSSDKSVRLWDARSGRCEQQALLKGENINVAYRPDAVEIAVGNNVDELSIVDARTFTVVQSRAYKYEVNEISWDLTGKLFLITTGAGAVEVLEYPSMVPLDTLQAHTAGVYCLAIDPKGRYFAAGSADSLVSMWDVHTMLCARTFSKLEWPVRTLSFSHDGQFLASASEDNFIDIGNVETGQSVHQIMNDMNHGNHAMNSVAWNPCYLLLAYAADDDGKYGNPGTFRVFGFESA